MRRRLSFSIAIVGALALSVSLAIAAASVHRASDSSYNVGIVYSKTGLLAAYGAEYVEGLKYGIKYATNGTEQGQRQDDQPHPRR